MANGAGFFTRSNRNPTFFQNITGRADYGDLPPEDQLTNEDLNRRQQIADMLLQQGLEPPPVGQMVGRFFVPASWSQGLAQLAKAGAGAYGTYKIGEKKQQLGEDRRQRVTQALGQIRTSLGTPPTPSVPVMQVGGGEAFRQPMPPTPPTPEQRNQAIATAIMSGDPRLQAWAQHQAQVYEKTEERRAQEAFKKSESKEVREARAEESALTREARKGETEARLSEAALGRAERLTFEESRAREANELRRDLAKMQTDTQKQIATMHAETQRLVHGAKGEKLTEAQGRAGLYATRADKADKIMADLEGKYSPLALNAKVGVGKTWIFGGPLEAGANVLLSKEAQKAEQAQRDFINAVLRQESGAVISESEFDNARKQYFPQPGDTKEVLLQKKQNRQTAIQGLTTMAGPAGRSIERPVEAQAVVPQGAPVVPFHDPQKEREYQEWKKQHRP